MKRTRLAFLLVTAFVVPHPVTAQVNFATNCNSDWPLNAPLASDKPDAWTEFSVDVCRIGGIAYRLAFSKSDGVLRIWKGKTKPIPGIGFGLDENTASVHWSSSTEGSGATTLYWDGGKLQLYKLKKCVWETATENSSALVFRSTGELQILKDGKAIWDTGKGDKGGGC